MPDDIEGLQFVTVREEDERGMEKTVRCYVFDADGTRVLWPSDSSNPASVNGPVPPGRRSNWRMRGVVWGECAGDA